MQYDFDSVKKEFMEIQTGEEWEDLKKKYPDMKFLDMDRDMKQHMNEIVRQYASAEQRKNPNIHYEVKKK